MTPDPFSLPGYDAWKLRSPDDCYYDDEPEDECEHDEYEIDILTGRASCDRCLHSWWATDKQVASEARRQADYADWVAEQERPWNRFKRWLRRTRLVERIRCWQFAREIRRADDEIPF